MNAKKRSKSLYEERGETVTVEVVTKNELKRYLIVETDNGHTTVLPESQLAGEDRAARAARFNELRARNGDTSGSELDVLVTDGYLSGGGQWKLSVSERALTEGTDEHDGDAPASNVIAPAVLTKARLLKEAGTTVRGTVRGRASGGGVVVDLGDFRGTLPADKMYLKKAGSLQNGQPVRVKVDIVAETGISLTRLGVA